VEKSLKEQSILENKKKVIWFGIFLVSALFYLVWYLQDGIILTEDAPSYMNMTSDREPGYCSFLWILRVIFGMDSYLHIAVIIQCLIAALAATILTYSLKKRFQLNWFVATGILVIQYGITLLNRFVAQRRYSYYNSIETEGLTYSFWVFFFLALLGILYDKNRKSILKAAIWAVVLISIRKQMLVTLPLIFLCILFVRFMNFKDRKKWYLILAEALLVMVLSYAGTVLVDCCYNLASRGVFAQHTGDSSFILGTEIYLANVEMVDAIKDEANKEIFLEIMRRADEKQYNLAYAEEGWHGLENHYSLSYDRIKFDIVNVVVREYQDEHGIVQELREAHYHNIASTLMKELLPGSIPNIIKLFGCNVITGMITTVLKVHPILNWGALFLYMAYIGLFVFLCWNKSYKKISVSALPLAAITMLSILGIVCLTSITIYCQMRYMLYNTPLFYQAGFIMLSEAWKMLCTDKRAQRNFEGME